LEEAQRLLAETGKPARGAAAKKAAARKETAAKKTAARKAATATKKAATKKAHAKKATKKAARAARPFSADLEPARPLITPAKVEPGRKRVVKKAGEAPF